MAILSWYFYKHLSQEEHFYNELRQGMIIILSGYSSIPPKIMDNGTGETGRVWGLQGPRFDVLR